MALATCMRAAFFAIADTSTGNVVAARANAAPKRGSHATQSAGTATLTGIVAAFLLIAAAGAGIIGAWPAMPSTRTPTYAAKTVSE